MQAALRAARAHRFILSIGLLGIGRGLAAASTGVAEPDVQAAQRAFAAEVASEGGPGADDVLAVLSGAQVQTSILDAIARPAEATRAWKDYRPIFLTDKRIDDGVAFYRANRELLDHVGAEYGVPPQIIVAIIGVETSYGRITGKYRVLDALATLAFHYPPRAAFFRGELKQLFLLGDQHLAYPIHELRGSYAGAMGWGQFMPTGIAKWARDEDGDGRIDLWNSLPDITASVANYFAQHGWQPGQPNVPLTNKLAVWLTMNSSSAASWPTRKDAPSPIDCSSQSVKSRVVGRASMLLTVKRLPTDGVSPWPCS